VFCNFALSQTFKIKEIKRRKNKMSYGFSKKVTLSYEKAIEKVTEELKKEGFGVLTEIDVKETLKKKLEVEFRKYKILGACNPPFAYQALQSEEQIGLMLPCNVIVYESDQGQTMVAAIDPVASMLAVQNPKLEKIASEIQSRLKRVIDRI